MKITEVKSGWSPKMTVLRDANGKLIQQTVQREPDGPIEIIYPSFVKPSLLDELKETLLLAREALESTETNFMTDQFDIEEKALVAIDFALERL